MDTFTSILDEPSRGSNSSRYSPLGSDSDQVDGFHLFGGIAAKCRPFIGFEQNLVGHDIQFLLHLTCTFSLLRCPTPAQRAFADRMARVLQARATVSMRSRTSGNSLFLSLLLDSIGSGFYEHSYRCSVY